MVAVYVLPRMQVWRNRGVPTNPALRRAVPPLAVDTRDVVDAVPALVLANGVEPNEVLLSVGRDLGGRSRDHKVAGDGPPVALPKLCQAQQE